MRMDCAIRWNVEKSSSEIGSVRGASQECFGTQFALDLTSTLIIHFASSDYILPRGTWRYGGVFPSRLMQSPRP